jgi:hypothetical protein
MRKGGSTTIRAGRRQAAGGRWRAGRCLRNTSQRDQNGEREGQRGIIVNVRRDAQRQNSCHEFEKEREIERGCRRPFCCVLQVKVEPGSKERGG